MRTIPNAIALIRGVALIPVIVLLDQGSTTWALAVFITAALTDAIDGPIARRLGAVTRLGTFIDPLADKVLILGTMLALLARGAVMEWVVFVIVAREIFATGLRGVVAGRGLSIQASGYGKAKTVVQALAVAALMLALAVPSELVVSIADAAVLAAVALTIASGVDLFVRGLELAPSGRVAANAR